MFWFILFERNVGPLQLYFYCDVLLLHLNTKSSQYTYKKATLFVKFFFIIFYIYVYVLLYSVCATQYILRKKKKKGKENWKTWKMHCSYFIFFIPEQILKRSILIIVLLFLSSQFFFFIVTKFLPNNITIKKKVIKKKNSNVPPPNLLSYVSFFRLCIIFY